MESLLVGGAGISGEDIVVGLRPGEPDDASEGTHELVLELELLLGGRTGAAPIQHNDGVLDASPAREGVDAFGYGVLSATGGIAGS